MLLRRFDFGALGINPNNRSVRLPERAYIIDCKRIWQGEFSVMGITAVTKAESLVEEEKKLGSIARLARGTMGATALRNRPLVAKRCA